MPARKLVAEELAAILGTIAHPHRIRIIEALAQGEKDVQALESELTLPQATVSQNLALLRAKKLVRARRDGRHVYYHLEQPWMASWLLDGLKLIEGVDDSDKIAGALKEARALWSKATTNQQKRS